MSSQPSCPSGAHSVLRSTAVLLAALFAAILSAASCSPGADEPGSPSVGGAGGGSQSAGGAPSLGGAGAGSGGSPSVAKIYAWFRWEQLRLIGSEGFILAGPFTLGGPAGTPGVARFDLEGALLGYEFLPTGRGGVYSHDPEFQGFAVDADHGDLTMYVSGTTGFPIGDAVQSHEEDYFLAKLDANGALLWARQFEEPSILPNGWGTMDVLSVDDEGNVYLFEARIQGPAGGATLLKHDPSGQPIWALDFEASDSLARGTPSGTTYVWNRSGDGFHLQEIDRDGELVFAESYGDVCHPEVEALSKPGTGIATVAPSADGATLYLVGTCLIKVEDHHLEWTRPLWEGGDLDATGVSSTAEFFEATWSDADDALFLLRPSSLSLNPPGYLARFDAEGEVVWSQEDIGYQCGSLSYDPERKKLLLLAGPPAIAEEQSVLEVDADSGEIRVVR